MQPAIMQNKHRVLVFTEENCLRRAVANEAIRRIRVRGGLLRIIAIHLDDARPLITLDAPPPDLLLEAANGLHSRRIEANSYTVRCIAFGCDWSWISTFPAVHRSRQVEQRPQPSQSPLPDNVAHPIFGGLHLRTRGDAR